VKIIFLSTGRGLRPEFINGLREKLGLHESDVVDLVSWQRPRFPLPVSRHLVLGPHLRVTGTLATVHRVQRQREPIATAAAELGTEEPGTEEPGTEELDTEEPGAESPGENTSPTEAAPATPQLPTLHPRRIRKAVAWRIRRLKRAERIRRLKRAERTQASSRLTGIRTHPLFRKVRNRLSPGVSLGFAASCLRAGKVHDLIRDADLVVALDAASQRGAWTLAQRVSGPEVVIGIPAAKYVIDRRRESAPL